MAETTADCGSRAAMGRIPRYGILSALLLIVTVLSQGIQAEVEQQDQVGIIEEAVRLPCRTPPDVLERLQWADFVYNSDRNPKLIFDAKDNPGHSVDTNHPRHTDYAVGPKMALTIRRLTLDDAGNYFCRVRHDDGSFTELHKYRLAVIGLPECSGKTDLTEGDSTDLDCKVKFNSNDLPSVEWFTNDEEQSADDHSDLDALEKTLPVTKVTADNDQQEYQCKVAIAGKSKMCKLKLDVKYAVRDIQITPQKDSYAVGDTIKCEARGNPVPSIHWAEDIPRLDAMEGEGWKSFKIDPEMQGKSQTFKCRASNMVGTKPEILTQEISFIPTDSEGRTVVYEDTSPKAKPKPIEVLDTEAPLGANTNGAAASSGVPKMGVIIGIAAGALLVIIIIIAAIVIARKKSDKKKGHMHLPTTEQHDWKTPNDTQGGSPGGHMPKGADRNSNGVTSPSRYPAYVTSTPQDRDPDTPWRRQSEAV